MKNPLIPDGPWRQPDYGAMQTAVAGAQAQRATMAGPPPPMMTSGVDVSQGVEQRARVMREMAGPQPTMMVNGVQRYNAPAATAAAATPPPPAMMSAPAPSMMQAPAPVNPLGGMSAQPLSAQPLSAQPLSARGGPMAYSQQGEGTTNPNAFRVGQNRAPLGMRLLERAARRRDPRAIGQLAGLEQQNAQNAQQLGMMQMREAGDVKRFGLQQQQQQTMFEQQQTAMQMRDATNFEQQKEIMQMQNQQRAGESAVEFQRRQEIMKQEQAARGDPTQVRAVPVPGTDYVIPYAGNQAMGTLKTSQPDAPAPAGLVPQRAMIGGVEYGPPPTAPNPTRLTPIPGRPADTMGGTPTPDRVFDPYTGEFYEAGKVPGRGTARAPAAAAATPAAGAQTAAAPAKKSRFMDLLNQR